MAAPPPAGVRSLYRTLLRIAARAGDDAPALRAEARARFREGASAEPAAAAALFAVGEARAHDARHHGIPHARLAHAAQHSARAMLEARRLNPASGGDGPAAAAERAAAAATDPAVRAALAAAADRLRRRTGGGG